MGSALRKYFGSSFHFEPCFCLPSCAVDIVDTRPFKMFLPDACANFNLCTRALFLGGAVGENDLYCALFLSVRSPINVGMESMGNHCGRLRLQI